MGSFSFRNAGRLIGALMVFALVGCSDDATESSDPADVVVDSSDAGTPSDAVSADVTADVVSDAAADVTPDPDTAGPSDVVESDADGDTVEPEPEPEPIGEPEGEAQSIDHAMVKATIDAHITAHLDGLDASLTFFENSNALNNLVEILFGDDDDDEGDEGEGEGDAVEEEETLELDLSGLREDLLEWLWDYVVIESTATANDAGTELTYLFAPEFFCAEDELGENPEPWEIEDKEKDEAECAEQIAASPLQLVATTDGEDRLQLVFHAGTDATKVLRIQLHSDMIAVFLHLDGLKAWLETFIDEEDFEFPDTMLGRVGVEVRQHDAMKYELRVAIEEAIELTPAEGQESLLIAMDQDLAPGGLMIDGVAETIIGELAMAEFSAGMPWQMMVDMMWDDEGHNEWTCEPDGNGGENCWDQWVDGPESPDVEGQMNVVVPGPTAGIHIDGATDSFHFMDLSLGGAPLIATVDGKAILQLDLNPEDDWMFQMTMVGEGPKTTRFEMSPKMDAHVTFSMDHVKDGLQDPPEFMLGDMIGIRMDGDEAPALKLMRTGEEDDVDAMVSAGTLTLWSDLMDQDVVIEAGQCIASVDDEELTEEEKDAQHDLFGGLYGGTCGE
jgi:hypothetical protein